MKKRFDFLQTVDGLWKILSRSNEWTNFVNNMEIIAAAKLATIGTPLAWTEAAKTLATPNGFTSDGSWTHGKIEEILLAGEVTPEKISAIEIAVRQISLLGPTHREARDGLPKIQAVLEKLKEKPPKK